MKNKILPAMVKSWIEEMLDSNQSDNTRHNRYMMLEHTASQIEKALSLYRVTTKRK